MIKKVKNTVPWTYAISDLSREATVGTFYEKESQNTNQTEKKLKKQSRKKVINYMSIGKVMIIGLIAW